MWWGRRRRGRETRKGKGKEEKEKERINRAGKTANLPRLQAVRLPSSGKAALL
jgi:hypothetical protein